jgi:hypothetical protein
LTAQLMTADDPDHGTKNWLSVFVFLAEQDVIVFVGVFFVWG